MAENRRTCASCGAPNEEDARFCEGCGTSLARECATCGVEASATARFCRGCGAPLDGQVSVTPDPPVAGPVRKTVTVMFADLAGSTTFEESVDAETAREVIGQYHELLRTTAQRHRAGVTKYIGDGFMAVWGVPEIGPDDAAHAVDAAVELQENFVTLAAHVAETHRAELALRVAVNTGEVVVGAGDADLVGDALNVGARLEAECPRGRVVVGEETWRATRGRYGYESLGQVQVKGRSAPVAVYQWLGRQSESADAAPFVGRSDEVRRLQAVLDDAIARRAARLVTVIGDPGVGKSRLAAEFTAAQGDVCVIEARCAVERTVALGPIVEVLRARDLESDVPASVPERDRLLRDLNGLTEGVAGSVEENFWALRRYVEVLASGSPVLLVLDDIQWAGTLLLDYIEHLMEWVQDVPVLVLALARPELREIRPDLVTVSRWVSEAVPLSGLDASATAELAANVLGAAQLPDELLRRLPSSTGGNPLFVRELVGMLAHDGVLVEQPTGWRLTIDVDAIAIPPTIHALLASRLERLDATDRRMLEIASVVGTDFSIGTVRALAGASADGLKRSLDRLRRLELVQPSGAYVGDEPVWRFHHVLIRDVAYRRLLKSDRADLHERLADWVASGGASVAFDNDELIARHLEAAHTYRLELGRLNEHTGEMALRAARHYAASARRALDRDELVSAGTQAARGAALANAAPAVHAQLLLTGCEAYLSAGDVAAGAPLVDELERIADDALEPWAACYRCQFIVYTAPERLLEVDARLQGAIDEFSRRADAAGLAKAHRVRASARFRLGRVGDAEIDLFEALIAARQSGDHRQITAALGAAPGAALWGPSPVPKAGGRCLDVVRMQRMTTAAPSLEATSMRHLAVLELLRGRPDKARTMLADARQIVADLGLRHGLMETELFAGIIESMEGDAVAAEPHFRTALEGLDALGVGADAGLAAALLARSVLAQGRIDEADRHAVESERLAGRNLKTAIAWRAVRAEILSAQGQHDRAVAMARDAVAVASGTDIVLDHAEACLALSRVLAAAGDVKGARVAHADAEKLYTAKEVAASIGRTVAPVALPSPAPAVEAPTASRLPVTNQSCEILPAFMAAMQAHDVDLALRQYSEQFVCDYHGRLGGDPIRDLDSLRNALELVFDQFKHFEYRVLAVRGQRSHLYWSRVSDTDGNQSSYLFVNEIDEAGRIAYQCGFDEDDFEGAYRELERRYYAGEGAAFAGSGTTATEWMITLNAGDFDRLFGELSDPDFRVENRSRTGFPDRAVGEVRNALEELAAMVSSSRAWTSALCWISPNVTVVRAEREAVGQDGEQYTWSWIIVTAFRDRRALSLCQFDIEDEESAFAYAEQLVRGATSRLAIANQASEIVHKFFTALCAHDIDGVVACYAAQYVHDDHRRFGGDLVRGQDAMGARIARFLEDYTHFEYRVLAVRGQRLALSWNRFADDDGNETTNYSVSQTDDGRVTYHGRFDEDDFEGAYRELDRRYYAGEGATVAVAGATLTDWTITVNNCDFDRLFGDLTTADFRIENRSRSAFPDRSADEYRATLEELSSMVASARSWMSSVDWIGSNVVVCRAARDAVGHNGEHYTWHFLLVSEVREGRLAVMCEFDLDDEEAAFAYAEERAQAATTRLAITNESCAFMPPFVSALRAQDSDGVVNAFAENFVYDDRRRLSGDPIVGREAMRAAVERIFGQYNNFEFRIMAVRGQRLNLLWSRWSDDDGNQTTTLYVNETDDDGRVQYHARFDEEDFEGAYREMEHRYYAGEGRQFAEAGATATEWMIALNAGDYDRLFGELTDPGFRLESRMLSVFGEPSGTELRASFEELNTMVSSSRAWCSACCWVSPRWAIARLEREAIGQDGEKYAWTRLHVIEIGDGRLVSDCRFDVEDEDAAFAYAEERVKPKRLAIANRASEAVPVFFSALRAHDVDAAVACYADKFVHDDRRRMSGDPLEHHDAMRAGISRFLEHYTQFEFHVLAVRGQRIALSRTRFADDDGNESSTFDINEIDEKGRVSYHGRFDEDDFESAYSELERRYYAGEGAAFAAVGTFGNEWVTAINRGDLDRAFGELTAPDFRIENRSGSAFADRSLTELRSTTEELNAMVSRSRIWFPVIRWLSPTWAIQRMDREAVGQNGETYTWSYVDVSEIRDGRLASACRFDIDDEDAAFAYAEERVRATTSRLAVANRASQILDAFVQALAAFDAERYVEFYADSFVYDDRRRVSGDQIADRQAMKTAVQRISQQYSHFSARGLAVRGERLHLGLGRFSNDDGYETAYLVVHEIGEDGRIIYEGRFDEDDFAEAYRELERRYYAGEGAAFAAVGTIENDWVTAFNRGDLDRAFSELTAPDFRIENRSSSAFADRSLSELRNTTEELNAMVSSSRIWFPVIRWLSPTWAIQRMEREAVGQNGETYTWSYVDVSEIRDGRLESVCRFDIEDEDAAFAYAEERIRATTSRLALTNRAVETNAAGWQAMRNHDVDGLVAIYADRFVFDDRRRLSGDPIEDHDAMRAAAARVLEQYNNFESRVLAVRGDRLVMVESRWSDDAGNETTQIHTSEVNAAGLVVYDGRFDDFDSAYRELDRRYRAGEGAAFAEAVALQTEWMLAMSHGDLDRVFGELSSPDLVAEDQRRAFFPERSAAEFRSAVEELFAMVGSARTWVSATCFVSPTWCVARNERETGGQDGMPYAWSRISVAEVRDGRVTFVRQFEIEDEEAAFAFAEEQARKATGHLAVINRASRTQDSFVAALRGQDVDGAVRFFADRFVYDDRRRLTGDPIPDKEVLRTAVERILEQYSVFDVRTLAVRGERQHLFWGRWGSDAGYETAYLFVREVDDDGRIVYEGRFDEDAFESAYRELDRRYFAGEGAAFAEYGATATEWITALNRSDYDRAFGELSTPGMRVENRSRAPFPDRSAAELRATFEELSERVAGSRTWLSAMKWFSPNWFVVRLEREATGQDGEHYQWLRVHVIGLAEGRMASVCQFEFDDVDAAFAYAEEQARASTGRLVIANRSTETAQEFWRAIRARDIDGVLECCSDQMVYDDQRRLSGDPILDRTGLRVAFERILAQYNNFDVRMLAVRGDHMHLAWSRWSNDAGYEAAYLHVSEVDDNGKIIFEGRFDEDDFVSAYRELDRRYYQGEGAAFAEGGRIFSEWDAALNQRDFDRVFGELTAPDMRVENRSSSVFGDRTAREIRSSIEELDAMVESSRSWHSVVHWLSPQWVVARWEREAVGSDGEHYSWSWLDVYEFRDRLVSACRFEVADTEAAFAYAEERVRATASRLTVANRASQTAEAVGRAMRAGDVDQTAAHYSDQCVSEDRRRLSGESIVHARSAAERVLAQYTQFDRGTLAVRGERLYLGWSRWSNADGYETTHLHVQEVGDDGRFVYDCIFDEADFVDAYRELNRRYYANEGAAYASAGATVTEYVIALHQGDLDRIVSELSAPDFQLENRSRSVFGDRTAAEFRAGQEELNTMVTSVRTFNSVMCWLSPTVAVSRFEREAIGRGGERYAWSFVIVSEIHGRRVTRVRQFEVDDEEAAFAYAEELTRASASRLAVANRASRTSDALGRASAVADVDGVVACYADSFVFDDRRRLSGDPVRDAADLRRGVERIFAQYNHFDKRTLAVRGDRLTLLWSRWWDDAGNETAYLHVREIDDGGRFTYDGRFDEDDFEGAYRELEKRYYAGEGAPFAESGATMTEFTMALNQGNLDRVLDELTAPGMRVVNRSRAVFDDRSADEFRAWEEQLATMVASTRNWSPAVCWLSPTSAVLRFERDAVGPDNEQYTWTGINVVEFRDGRLASTCLFEADDEDAAFAYAENQARVTVTRLPTTNRASQTAEAGGRALNARDVEAIAEMYAESFVFDDRRRIGGNPIGDLQIAQKRILEQYNHFEGRTLAVRSEHLSLAWSRWSNESGYETTYLFVHEVDDSGRFTYEGRFDEDNLEAAYRTLEQRYYASEGAAFAAAGSAVTEYPIALAKAEFDRLFGEIAAPGFQLEDRSRSLFGDRSENDLRATYEDLLTRVGSLRIWHSTLRWLSPNVVVARFEQDADGLDGERYTWTHIDVAEIRAGQVTRMCLFETDDEAAAFAYAEERVRATATRLPITNRAKQAWDAAERAAHARDPDAAAAIYSPSFSYDDRRRVSGLPIEDIRSATAQLFEQFTHFALCSHAVRGDRLHLGSMRMWNDSGFESSSLWLQEVGDNGLVVYQCRFDEDDFNDAYRELTRRFCAGEGVAVADVSMKGTEYLIAINEGNFDLFDELNDPNLRVENRTRTGLPDRSAGELRSSYEQLNAMVGPSRSWNSVEYWLSPSVGVVRHERLTLGRDGEDYAWTKLMVAEWRDGRCNHLCLFEPDDEDAAFAYAEERVRATPSRLALTNRAKHTWDAIERATLAGDLDGAAAYYSPSLVYDDRRRLSGNPIEDMRSALKQIAEQYTQYEFRSLAIRGDRLQLASTRWVNDSGFESNSLWVHEVDDDGLISYQCRFDEDDFEGAYRELDNRYFAGDGAAFAEAGAVQTEWLTALNRGDLDRLFGELTSSDMRFEIRSSSAFPDSTTTEARAALEDLNATLSSSRTWLAATCWVSPTCCVTRFEREALGRDGEEYAWTRLSVVVYREGRMASECDFELNDEEAAFAYAENQVRSPATLLPVTNRASRTVEAVQRAMDAHDVDGVVAGYSDSFEYDDRRRLSGDPIVDVRTATERVLQQYTHFERRTLAVRGEYLVLGWGRRSNEAGFETAYLVVHEIDDDGLIVYQARFDEDDFNAAYRELTRRYCAGEGAAVADIAALGAEYLTAINEGAFDRMVSELTVAGARIENRTRSGFPDRSVAELRASFEDLNAMVGPTRSWNAVERWLSPTCGVVRSEREAYGQDGEHYEWTMLVVFEAREGRATHLCEFDLDDEAAAFAYAEERARAANTRLPITNRARRAWDTMLRAASALDADAMTACYGDSFSWDDRRHLALDRPDDLPKALRLVLDQYGLVESRTLAVRGDSLHLGWCRWTNDAGQETTYLFVHEVGDDERWVYEGPFDGDDFNAAYRHLEERYYTGEGAEFAEAGAVTTDVTIALNGDLDRVFDELFAPDVRLENYSRSMLVDVSASEYRTSLEELNAVVASVRTWNSAVRWLSPSWNVVRYEREALGRDSEQYTWSRICATEVRNGRMTRASVFEVEDEERAFAYAEERIRLAEGS